MKRQTLPFLYFLYFLGAASAAFAQTSGYATVQTPWNGERVGANVSLVNAPAVWPRSHGKGIGVAILGSGVACSHPDLSARCKPGANFFDSGDVMADATGEGTAYAGIIAAAQDNKGLIGIAFEADIYPVKVAGVDGRPSSTAVAKGLDWCTAQSGVNIILVPFTVTDTNDEVKKALAKAANAGKLIIAAAGDSGHDLDFPATSTDVVSVSGLSYDLTRSPSSNYGAQLSAPANAVATAIPGQGIFWDVLFTSGDTVDGDPAGFSAIGTVGATLRNSGTGLNLADFPNEQGYIARIAQKGSDADVPRKARNAVLAKAAGIVFVNDGLYPAPISLGGTASDWPVVISVSGADADRISAQEGKRVTIRALKCNFTKVAGTGVAAAHAAGVAALVWSAKPDASTKSVVNALMLGAHDLGPAGWDRDSGQGLVNAAGAVQVLVGGRRRAASH